MERFYSFDLLKFIAIVLVVCYHSFCLGQGAVYDVCFPLFSLGVPLFFIVNGALLFNKALDTEKHYKKIVRIVLLTVIWTFGVFLVIDFIEEKGLSFTDIIKIAWYGDSKYVVNQYWFLKTLVMLYLFFPVLKRAFDVDWLNTKVFTLVLSFFVIGMSSAYLCHQTFNFFMGKPLSLEMKDYIPWYNFCKNTDYSYALAYFLLGGVSFRCGKRFSQLGFCLWLFLFLLAWGIGVCLAYMFRIEHTGWDACFNAYSSPMTFMMSFCLFFIFVMYKPISVLNSIIEGISKNTLGIYLVHGIVIYFTKPYVGETFVGLNILYSFAILFLSWGIVCFFKRVPYIRWIFKI